MDSKGVPTGSVLWYLPADRTIASFSTEEDPHFFVLSPKEIKYSYDGKEWFTADEEELDTYGLLRLLDPRFLLRHARINQDGRAEEAEDAQIEVQGTVPLYENFPRVPPAVMERLAMKPVSFFFAESGLVQVDEQDLDPSGERITIKLVTFPPSLPPA